MKLSLMLNVIDPNIGGVLIMGDRGTGKSVAVSADMKPGWLAILHRWMDHWSDLHDRFLDVAGIGRWLFVVSLLPCTFKV